MCQPSLLAKSFHTHMYQIIVMYTLNFYNVICELHLNKLGETPFNK